MRSPIAYVRRVPKHLISDGIELNLKHFNILKDFLATPLIINYLSHFSKATELSLLLLISLHSILSQYPNFYPVDLSKNHICFNSLIPNPR